jgi:hypothetical protein
MVKWIRTGTPPPRAPPMQVISASPPLIARDARGNALDGIRLAEMEVPVAKNAADTCEVGGTHVMFDTATLPEFVRVNDLANRNHVRSVIVADTNGRFFEPAVRRNNLARVTVNASF